MLDVRGQLRDFPPVDGMDLVDGDDESCALGVQQAEQFVPGPAPIKRPFRRELGCQSKPCG
jgi:hypothetical protein